MSCPHNHNRVEHWDIGDVVWMESFWDKASGCEPYMLYDNHPIHGFMGVRTETGITMHIFSMQAFHRHPDEQVIK